MEGFNAILDVSLVNDRFGEIRFVGFNRGFTPDKIQIIIKRCCMKSPKLFIAVTIALVFVGAVAAYSQGTDNPVTVASILKTAGCALTADQTKKLADLDVSAGREAFQTINSMFTEPQVTALKKALGASPGRNDGPERPRYLTQVIIFEKGKCPLTEKQLTALIALPNERGSNAQATAIYNDKQKAEMAKIYPNRSN